MNDVLDEIEVAKILDCEPKTVQEKARNGDLPAVKYGRSWRFPRAALLQSLNDLAMCNMEKIRKAPAGVLVGQASRRKKLPALVQ